MRSFALCAALAPSIAAGMFWDGPAPTIAAETFLDPYGMSPVPTNPPGFNFELFKRQTNADDEDRYCGYVSSDYNNALTCNTGYVCAVNTRNNAAGCCKSESLSNGCTLSTRCIEYAALSTAGASAGGDLQITKCTNSLYPYCYTAVFPIGSLTLSYYGCSTSRNVETAYQAYSNGPAVSGTTRSTGFPLTSRTVTGGSTSTTGTSTTSTSASASASTAPASSGSKSNAGAIAGGVVGGLGVLALVAGGVVFLLFRNKKKKQQQAAVAPGAPGAPHTQPPPMAEQQHAYGAPPPQPQYAPQQGPPQQGYYPPQAGALPPKQDYYNQPPPQQQHNPHLSQYGNSQYGSQFGSPPHSPSQAATSPVAPSYQPSASPVPHGVAEAPGAPVGQRPPGAPVHELA